MSRWEPEGIPEEHIITVAGKRETLYAHPYKWFSAIIYNAGPYSVKVMINTQSLPKALTLAPEKSKEFNFGKPAISQIELETSSNESAVVTITAMR